MIFPIAIEMLARLKSASVSVNRACSCGGRFSRMGCSGNSTSLIFSAGAGAAVAGRAAGFGWGVVNCGMGTGGGGAACGYRSRRLGSVRSSFVLIKASQQFSQQPGKSCFYSIWHRTQLFPRTMNPTGWPIPSRKRATGGWKTSAEPPNHRLGRDPAGDCLTVGLAVHKAAGISCPPCGIRNDNCFCLACLRVKRFAGLNLQADRVSRFCRQWNGNTAIKS